MTFHEFGVMKRAPAWEEMYEKYDLSLCGETAAVEDDEVNTLWEHFGSIPCFWHSLQRPTQGLAYTGITLIPPSSAKNLLDRLPQQDQLCSLKGVLHSAWEKGCYVIHFGI